MRYVSIDLETTGLDPETCQILEFAAIVDDLNETWDYEQHTFHRFLEWESVTGSPFALHMNARILGIISGDRTTGPQIALQPTFVKPKNLGFQFAVFLKEHGIDPRKVVPAGKNFTGFDRMFLDRLPGFKKHIGFIHRALDPAILYLKRDDEVPPGTNLCLQRAGFQNQCSHRAVDDALDVIKLMRRHFG